MIGRLRRQEGVALTVAIFTLSAIALFSALVASSAVQLGDTSNDDRDQKRALGAAEAGINTALYRLNAQGSALSNLGCLTDIQLGVLAQATPYVTAGTSVTVQAGQCPGAKGRAGNGGEWTYWITLLNNDQNCDEQYYTQTQVDNLLALQAGGVSVLRRCITAIGGVNGVTRRLQREIYSEFRLFHGLIGTDSVTVSNGASANASHIGSNGQVTIGPGIYTGQVELQEDAPPEVIQATGQWGVTRRNEPWIVDPVEVTTTSPNPSANPSVSCVLLCSPWAGASSDRRLSVSTGKTVTMNAGTYNLCEVSVTGGTLVISGTVKIFLDSDCANGQGKLTIRGGALVNTTGLAVAQNLQIYAESSQDIRIQGGVLATQANLALYAPNANVFVEKGTGNVLAPIVKGSISSKQVTLDTGASFIGDLLLDITAPFAQIAGKWHPGAWSECPPKPPGENPHEGCNG